MTDKPKESKGQEEMEETGEKLDDRQQDQLDAFLTNLDTNPPKEEEEEEEAPKASDKHTEEEIDDAKTSDEESEAEEFDEELAGSEEEGDEEEGEEEVDELVGLRAEIAEQKKLLNQLAAQKQLEKEEKEDKIVVEIDPATLITEEEAAEFLTDPHKVLSTLAERIYVKAREDTLKDIPQLVESGARRQSALNEAQKTFRKENADLMAKAEKIPAVDRLIRMTANELQAENPAWTVAQIFEETGKQVRAAISLNEKAQKIEKEVMSGKKKSSNQPTKPRGKRRSPGKGAADERSGLQKDLDAMLESRG